MRRRRKRKRRRGIKGAEGPARSTTAAPRRLTPPPPPLATHFRRHCPTFYRGKTRRTLTHPPVADLCPRLRDPAPLPGRLPGGRTAAFNSWAGTTCRRDTQQPSSEGRSKRRHRPAPPLPLPGGQRARGTACPPAPCSGSVGVRNSGRGWGGMESVRNSQRRDREVCVARKGPGQEALGPRASGGRRGLWGSLRVSEGL